MDSSYWKGIVNKLRCGRELTQEAFAEVCGVSKTAVQNWERGVSIPHVKTCERIIKNLGLRGKDYPELFEYVFSGKKPSNEVGDAVCSVVPAEIGDETAGLEQKAAEGAADERFAEKTLTYTAVELPAGVWYNSAVDAAELIETAEEIEPTNKKPKEPVITKLRKKWRALHPICKSIISAFCVWLVFWGRNCAYLRMELHLFRGFGAIRQVSAQQDKFYIGRLGRVYFSANHIAFGDNDFIRGNIFYNKANKEKNEKMRSAQ